MIARSLILTVCIAVLSPGLPRAQESSSLSAGAAAAADSTADRKMYEDIEILRRILDRKLHTLYPPNTWAETTWKFLPQPQDLAFWGVPNAGLNSEYRLLALPNRTVVNEVMQEVSYQLEGVYLKGQGVVYTVTLPTLQASTKVKKPAKPISEWDSVRREFRKDEKELDTIPKTAGLREVLLKVLAENGHHFSRLGENESLTIVVTVHEESNPQPPRKSEEKPAKTGSSEAAIRMQAFGALSAIDSKTHDLELLGDLHLKQGRYEEAIKSFLTAVEKISDSKQKAALHRKLAQAYLMQEKIEKARSHIDQAIALLKKAEDAKNKPAPAAKPKADALPVKMIISVPKKLLDQAGEGKMPFEEFCRRAKVETLRFEEPR